MPNSQDRLGRRQNIVWVSANPSLGKGLKTEFALVQIGCRQAFNEPISDFGTLEAVDIAICTDLRLRDTYRQHFTSPSSKDERSVLA